MKTRAIVFFGLFDRIKSVITEIIGQSDCYVICNNNDTDLKKQCNGRLIFLDEVVDMQACTAAGNLESEKRCYELSSFLFSNLGDLPYSQYLDTDSENVIARGIQVGLRLYYTYINGFKKLLEQFDIRCSVLSPSYLDKYQAVAALSKVYGIPSIHLQHGSWITNEILLPEVCDVVALADNFGLQILNQFPVSGTKKYVTGTPFTSIESDDVLDVSKDKLKRAAAKELLQLDPKASIILYTCPFMEGLYLTSSCLAFQFVETLENIISVAKAREEMGKPTIIIVRQNPGRTAIEDVNAILSVGEELNYNNLVVISDRKDSVMTATDIIVSSMSDSSVLLDACAAGRPCVAMHMYPRGAHLIGCTIMSNYCSFVQDYEQLNAEINGLLDNEEYWLKRQHDGYKFAKGQRPFSAYQGQKNIGRLIVDVANHKTVNFVTQEQFNS